MKRPKLVIVTGRPAAGKSTLAKKISEELKLPFVGKDDIREILFDDLGWKDRPWAKLLSRVSVDLMFHFAEAELSVGNSIIMDNSFHPPISTPRFQELKQKFNAESLQIICNSSTEILFERFKARAETGIRHPGHGDNDVLDELYKNLTNENPQFLDIGGLVIEVDTTNFEKVDYQGILDQARLFLEKE